jgi:hypothetical protein
MTRSHRNRFIERWAGRGRDAGDVEEDPLSIGQDAGLIRDIPNAADVVGRITKEAELTLTKNRCPSS